MRSYVVLTTDEKEGTLYPDVIGPFPTGESALAWVKGLGNAHVWPDDHPHWPGGVSLYPVDGGYAGFVIVNDETATPVEQYQHWADDPV